jgi:hypothetical protein
MPKLSRIPMALIVALAACEQPTAPLEEAQFSQVPRTGVVELAGTFTYSYVQVKTGTELTPWQVFNVRATLTFTGKDQMVMILDEYEVPIPRVTMLEGKMTPSGVLRMVHTAPPAEVLLAIVTGHLGCTISGPFPVFSGKFDGTRLVASTMFNGQCKEYWPANNIFPTPMDGPVHGTWAMDLTVVP